MYENIFHIFVTMICLINALWWDKSDALNLFIKLIFTIGALWGILVCLNDFGYLIKL